MITILASCIAPAVEPPPGSSTTLPEVAYIVLFTVDITTSIIFSVESLLNLIDVGPGRFIRSPTLLLELFIVLTSWVLLIWESSHAGDVASFVKVLRALRPVQALARVPSMEITLGALGSALVNLGAVGLLALFFFMCSG